MVFCNVCKFVECQPPSNPLLLSQSQYLAPIENYLTPIRNCVFGKILENATVFVPPVLPLRKIYLPLASHF